MEFVLWMCQYTVTLKIRNKVVNQALLLDAAGYPVSTIDMVQIGNELQITLPANAMYVMLVNTTHSNNIDLKEMGMRIFPNPSNGNFRVEIQNYKPSAYSMELLGLRGEKFLEIKSIQQSTFHVNTNKLANESSLPF